MQWKLPKIQSPTPAHSEPRQRSATSRHCGAVAAGRGLGPSAARESESSIDISGVEEAVPGERRHLQSGFWYSRQQALLLVTGLFLLIRVFGSLIPPFQSPDEFNHVKRAYLLSHGVLVVGNRETLTGGAIDEGMLAYMDCFQDVPFNYGAKVGRGGIRTCNKIHYTGTRRFSSLPNTAMYFPFLYAPQALALSVSERIGLAVGDSYYLARLFSSCVTLALLLCALMTYPAPPAVLALFLLPMCLFQLSSASLDAISFAMTVLAACLFLRGCRRELSFSLSLHVAFAVCLLLLATSRIIYVALSPLLLALYRVRRSPTYLVSFLVVLGLSISWTLFALSTVHGQGAIVQEISSRDIVTFYIAHPGAFVAVVFRTLSDGSLVQGWWEMFAGILGWLDTPIGSVAYVVLAIELAAIILVSTPAASLRSLTAGHLMLAGGAAATMMLLFLVALSAWSIHPATVIDGIQGRYLYPIAFLLLFSCWTSTPSRTRVTLSLLFLIAMAVSSLEFAVPRLLDRYGP